VDRLGLAGIAIVLTMPLWAAMRFTRFGLAITASAENERAVSMPGWSANLLTAVASSDGCALAGVELPIRHVMFNSVGCQEVDVGSPKFLVFPASAATKR